MATKPPLSVRLQRYADRLGLRVVVVRAHYPGRDWLEVFAVGRADHPLQRWCTERQTRAGLEALARDGAFLRAPIAP